MPKTLVTTLIHNVATQLNDVSYVHWKREELLAWFNSARKAVIEKRPDSNAQNIKYACTNTAKQALPESALRLLSVIGNHNGSGITSINKNILDVRIPNWLNSTETTNVKHFVYDPKDPKKFYLYPRPKAGHIIEILVSEFPEDTVITNFETDDQTILIDDQFANPIENYMLSRAWLKDANYASNPNLSAKYYSEFLKGIGDATSADAVTSAGN